MDYNSAATSVRKPGKNTKATNGIREAEELNIGNRKTANCKLEKINLRK